MTLDISTMSDYISLNWTGVHGFIEWCKEKKLPHPFPKWSGGNPGVILDSAVEEDRLLLIGWVNAFEGAFPAQAEMGVAESITDAYRAGLKDDESELQWNLWLATAWYHQLKSALDSRSKIKFG